MFGYKILSRPYKSDGKSQFYYNNNSSDNSIILIVTCLMIDYN